MKNLMKFAALGAALAISTLSAHAASITGGIDIGGFDATSFGSCPATGSGCVAGAQEYLNFNNPVSVQGADGTLGNFPVIGGVSTATLTSLDDLTSANLSSEDGVELFYTPTLLCDATIYCETFTINSISSISYTGGTNPSLTILGTGTFTESGYTATAGTFDLSTSGPHGFTTLELSSDVAATPEPSSLMLLGTGLTGAAGIFFRRRRTA